MNEDLLKAAMAAVLPRGYKPEDYLVVGAEYPLRIARMVVAEYQLRLELQKLDAWKQRVRAQPFFYPPWADPI